MRGEVGIVRFNRCRLHESDVETASNQTWALWKSSNMIQKLLSLDKPLLWVNLSLFVETSIHPPTITAHSCSCIQELSIRFARFYMLWTYIYMFVHIMDQQFLDSLTIVINIHAFVRSIRRHPGSSFFPLYIALRCRPATSFHHNQIYKWRERKWDHCKKILSRLHNEQRFHNEIDE